MTTPHTRNLSSLLRWTRLINKDPIPMNIRNWIMIGLSTAAAASVGTVASNSQANCTGNTQVGFFGTSSCSAPGGAFGHATGTNTPFARTLTAFFDTAGVGDTTTRAQGLRSGGAVGCTVNDTLADGLSSQTGCSAATSVDMNMQVF
jgi:hypothetical protein